jgi:hypothetical protein
MMSRRTRIRAILPALKSALRSALLSPVETLPRKSVSLAPSDAGESARRPARGLQLARTRTAPIPIGIGAVSRESHRRATLPPGSPAVPSPRQGLTSVFGMGTGVAPAPWTVGKLITGGHRLPNIFLGPRSMRRAPRARRASGQASRAISTGPLHTLLCFHSRPIDVLVSDGPSGDRSLGEISSWGGLPT